MPKLKNQSIKFLLTSLRLPLDLHQQLLKKMEDLGETSLNKTIGMLLESALYNPRTDKHFQYTVMLYALMQEAILSLVEEPQSLLDRAEQRAAKILQNFSQSPLDV